VKNVFIEVLVCAQNKFSMSLVVERMLNKTDSFAVSYLENSCTDFDQI
jgi:hypothetical protein